MADIEALVYTYPDIGDPEFQKLLSTREEFWPDTTNNHETSDRNRIKQFVRRFMVQYDRLLLFHSTGSGKTCMSSGAAEPLVRGIVSEVYETYLSPVRTNITKVIVILTSEHSRDDFMQKIIEKCHPKLFAEVYNANISQNMITKLAAYGKALDPYYRFETKQTFLTGIYGQNASPDIIEAPETALTYYHNKFFIIDEIHTFSREDAANQADEDLVYARYDNIFHRLKGIKLIVMTGTPMKDKPKEIIKIMNFILPLSGQMPEDMDVFDSKLMSKYLTGYVSYYQMTGIRTIERGVMLQLGPDPGEFVSVYPVKMSDFQASIYKQVIKEKDVFNQNALKSSNIVYPQGIATKDFLQNYTESLRGGYEPTTEFKNYIKSRKNRELLSAKFCAVVDIIKNTFGVIFCYMEPLKFGIYDLAAFLEAEGFERYVPRTDHPYKKRADGTNELFLDKRPRFAILVGETKRVRGKLESILALNNLPENADGEYLKVIIGSTAVREAYDIFNSITAIIVSPGQTETSMIQAVGRTTRSGGLDHILALHPELKAIVNIYKMASYADDYNLSKDIDTYVESAKKDRKIKVVERILRENAVDCQIHHDLNFNKKNIDGSYACLYGDCDYTCAMPPLGEEELETDAMDVLYQGDKILSITTKIKEMFKERFYVTMSEISALADSQTLAFRAVEEMNVQKMRLTDRFNQDVYLYFDRKGVYVSPQSIIKSTEPDGITRCEINPVEYSHYITSANITSLDELVKSPLRIPDIIEKIMTTNQAVTDSLETDQNLLDKFKFYIRREVVSRAEVLEHIRGKGDKQRKGEITGTSEYWINYSGKLLSHSEIKVYEGDVGICRVPTGMEIPKATEGIKSSWIYPDKYLARLLNNIWRKIMLAKFKPYEDKYKYFGLIIPTEPDALSIAESGKDNAKNPGKVCSSWKREELQDVAKYIGIPDIQNTSKFVKDWCQILTEEFRKRDMLLIF